MKITTRNTCALIPTRSLVLSAQEAAVADASPEDDEEDEDESDEDESPRLQFDWLKMSILLHSEKYQQLQFSEPKIFMCLLADADRSY